MPRIQGRARIITAIAAALAAALTVGGVALFASSASAMIPVSLAAGPGPSVGSAPVATVPIVTGIAPSTVPAATVPVATVPACPPAMTGASTAASSLARATLPQLGARLQDAVRRYAQNPPAGASVSRWYDSGGPFGGGVPAPAVELMMRKGLANGLTQEQVLGFLNPSLLRGINDPYGGGAVLRFIAARGDSLLYGQLAGFAAELGGRAVSSMSAQQLLFQTFPQLGIVYMAQAGAAPVDEASASYMVDLAEGGYAPARRTIDAVLASGNHPRAGAQDSGGVADLVDTAVYDVFATTYDGPLSAEARQAVANRRAYNGWVGRIDEWRAAGSDMTEVPEAVTFPVSPSSVSVTGPAPASGSCS